MFRRMRALLFAALGRRDGEPEAPMQLVRLFSPGRLHTHVCQVITS